jgi:hypothetical protein
VRGHPARPDASETLAYPGIARTDSVNAYTFVRLSPSLYNKLLVLCYTLCYTLSCIRCQNICTEKAGKGRNRVNDHPLKRVACEEQADVDQFARKGSR